MNRISTAVLTAGALALVLVGCDSGEESAEASGLRKGTPDSTTSEPAAAPTTGAASSSTTSSNAAPTPAPGLDAQITCAEFQQLDSDREKQAIELILAGNPGNQFEGSPNVALGTVKLLCHAPGNADKPVAEVIRVGG